MNKSASAWVIGSAVSIVLVVGFLVLLVATKPSQDEIESAKKPTVPVPSGLLAPDNLEPITSRQVNGDLPIRVEGSDSLVDNPFAPLP